MLNRAIILPLDVWDRIIEILDTPFNKHADADYILGLIQSQLQHDLDLKQQVIRSVPAIQATFIQDTANPSRLIREEDTDASI